MSAVTRHLGNFGNDTHRWTIFKGQVTGRWRILSPLAEGNPSSWSFPNFEAARAAFAAGDPHA